MVHILAWFALHQPSLLAWASTNKGISTAQAANAQPRVLYLPPPRVYKMMSHADFELVMQGEPCGCTLLVGIPSAAMCHIMLVGCENTRCRRE
jgi:hypothetical protein